MLLPVWILIVGLVVTIVVEAFTEPAFIIALSTNRNRRAPSLMLRPEPSLEGICCLVFGTSLQSQP